MWDARSILTHIQVERERNRHTAWRVYPDDSTRRDFFTNLSDHIALEALERTLAQYCAEQDRHVDAEQEAAAHAAS